MIKMLLKTVAVLLCSSFTPSRSSTAFDVTVAAGQLERKNLPVSVQLHPGQLGDARFAFVTLTLPDGTPIPAQLPAPGLILGGGREIHFRLMMDYRVVGSPIVCG
jgi:hypothetical protein